MTQAPVRELLAADYCALYRARLGPTRFRRFVAIVRFFISPSLRAVLRLRLGNASPRWTAWLWRSLLVGCHSMDWGYRSHIGPGLSLPHPVGIVMAPTVRVGKNVMIGQNVTIGGDGHNRAPVIGDDVEIFPGAVVVGGITIGDGAVIGANSFVNRDLASRTVFKRGIVEPLRRTG